MSQKQVPENAIDRFFYKIRCVFQNIFKTFKESQVVHNLIIKPMTTGPFSVILWYILIIIVISILIN